MRGSLVLALRHSANHGGEWKEEGVGGGGEPEHSEFPAADECVSKSALLTASLVHVWSSESYKSDILTDDATPEYASDTTGKLVVHE